MAVIFNRTTGEPLVLPCASDPPTAADLLPVPDWDLLKLVRGWIDGVKSWPSLNAWSEFF